MRKSRVAFLIMMFLVFSGGFYFSVCNQVQGYTYNFDEVLDPYDSFQLNFTIPVGGSCRVNFQTSGLVAVEYYTLFYDVSPPTEGMHKLGYFGNWWVQNSSPISIDVGVVFYNPTFGLTAHVTGWVSNDFFTANSELVLILVAVAVLCVAVGVVAFIAHKKFPRVKEQPIEIEREGEIVKTKVNLVKCPFCETKYEVDRIRCPNCGAVNKLREK